MKIITDLHIHGKYSRACSKELTIPNLEKWARVKGVGLLGTGDFTHPKWIEHIKEHLTEKEGILKTKTGFPFILQTEISLIYTQDGKGRSVHILILAPSLEVVEQITAYLLTKGRVDYDGRPIFKIPCYQLVEDLRKISTDIEVIPAHAWTPHFGLFGANGGFNSVEEAFKDQAKHIHALETGLSSDPEMNLRLSGLDKYLLVSFSDCHSFWPWRIGREATIFDINPTYKELLKAIRTREGFVETIEVNPAYGKYHIDGHRNCNVSLEPNETQKVNNLCPKCHKPLTIGVLNRVEQLADRKEGYKENIQKYKTIIPLSDLISQLRKKGVATKAVWNEYNPLIEKFGNEYNILLNVPEEELTKANPELAPWIILNRAGKIQVKPGYDGVYGEPILKKEQKGLNDY
ncbi:MAG: endonuclease Q family protein [archaeon]